MFNKFRTTVGIVMYLWAAILAVRGLYLLAWDIFKIIKNRRNRRNK